MIRIAVVVGDYPESEKQRRANIIRNYSTDNIDVDVVNADANPYTPGFDGNKAKATVPDFVNAFRQAELEGYDAVSPLGVLDIAVEEGRSAVSIPVVGALFSSLQMARTLGGRLGLIVYSDNLIPSVRTLADRYGTSSLFCTYGSVGLDLTTLAAHRHELKERFCATAYRMVKDSQIDAVICAGISICPLHVNQQELAAELGIPVIEAIGAPINFAAAIARTTKTK